MMKKKQIEIKRTEEEENHNNTKNNDNDEEKEYKQNEHGKKGKKYMSLFKTTSLDLQRSGGSTFDLSSAARRPKRRAHGGDPTLIDRSDDRWRSSCRLR